jgi:hypothetical protein
VEDQAGQEPSSAPLESIAPVAQTPSPGMAAVGIQLLETLRDVLIKPHLCFAGLAKDTGYKQPLFFLLMVSAVFAVLKSLLAGKLLQALPLLLMCVAMAFVNATFLYFVSKLIKTPVTYNGALRVICYSSAPLVLSWISLIHFVCGVYSLVLIYFGLEKMLQLTRDHAVRLALCMFVVFAIMHVFHL